MELVVGMGVGHGRLLAVPYNSRMRTVTLRPLSGTLGVQVEGIDVRTVDDSTVGELGELLTRHHLLLFRNQDITPRQHAAFAARFGPLSVHPRLKAIDDAPELIEVFDPTNPIATTWHQDQTFLPCPPSATMLAARVLPPAGGDTMFANQHAAFEALSPAMQGIVAGLRAVHRRVARDGEGRVVEHDEAVHPVAPRHPVTGRRALFVNRDYTVAIDGFTAAESAALLEFLYTNSSRPEFTCRHRWDMGDVIVWDNRSLLHCVVGDATGPRLLHKATMAGDSPR
jgi:taurine dioxygenase